MFPITHLLKHASKSSNEKANHKELSNLLEASRCPGISAALTSSCRESNSLADKVSPGQNLAEQTPVLIICPFFAKIARGHSLSSSLIEQREDLQSQFLLLCPALECSCTFE